MGLTERYNKVFKQLGKINQQHILAFWNQLNDQQKLGLLEQIEQLDFSRIAGWVENYVKKDSPFKLPEKFEPADYYSAEPRNTEQKKLYDKAVKLGADMIACGRVAAFMVAGGQGTRLGFDGPKGNFPISPIKNKTLFRLFAEYIAAAEKKYNSTISWYIMTSPLNHDQTQEIFRNNNFYGLEPGQITFFQQGTMPNFSLDGKILMADKYTIASSPDGHGGSLRAMYNSGAIADMKKKGVELISYFQVDNPLINILDPLFIGLTAMNNSQMSSKAVLKAYPKERVGNFCLVDGRVVVIEYSDLPDETAEKRNADGSLVFELGSIAIHIIARSFVEQLNAKGFALPLHRAVKKIQHIDEQGGVINPEKPNGIKLEAFVFDALPMADNSIIVETKRSKEFSPVKNADGVDSPATARKDLIRRAAEWLRAAGVKVPTDKEGNVDCIIEMAASFAIEPADVINSTHLPEMIKPGEKIYLE